MLKQWRRFNDVVSSHVAVWLVSMEVFWVLILLTWGSVLIHAPSNAQGWDLFLVSIFYQGIALPAVSAVTNKQGDRTAALLQETHDATMLQMAELKALHAEESEELRILRQRTHVLGEKQDALLNRLPEEEEKHGG